VLVQRLQAPGAVLLGALNMDEYAYGFTTENTHYGPTRNPHDLHASPAAPPAVPARRSRRTGAAALGSDTNGSIRVPASLCGVWGLKPTFGRLSRRGSYPFVHSLDHSGRWPTASKRLALAYDAMQGADPLDPGCHALRVQPASDAALGTPACASALLAATSTTKRPPAARAVAALAARTLGASDEVRVARRRAGPRRRLHHHRQRRRQPAPGRPAHAAAGLRAAVGGPFHLRRAAAGRLVPAAPALPPRLPRPRQRAVPQWDVLIAPATR
jgi:amidase/aspartyl-tRNA(Asn)/glutamyl-tRNA(Gln) amidotransferase subunit A